VNFNYFSFGQWLGKKIISVSQLSIKLRNQKYQLEKILYVLNTGIQHITYTI